MKGSGNEIRDNNDSFSLAQCHLFVQYFMGLLNLHILQLENQLVTSSKLHDKIFFPNNKLENRSDDQVITR